jgi:hypothetical protein
LKGIEGVSLLGGEPFEQPAAVAELCAGVRALGLSVMVFSGFTLAELKARGEAETSGNHEVDHQDELTGEFEDDPLSDSAETLHFLAHRSVKRWIEGAKHRNRGDPDPGHRFAEELPLETLDIDGDIGELRHRRQEKQRDGALAPSLYSHSQALASVHVEAGSRSPL